MRAEAFLDTNVLVYAVAADARHAAKTKIAARLIESVDFGLSVQVLSEFYVTVTRKIAAPLPVARAREFVRTLASLPLVDFDAKLVFEAMEFQETFQISYWDAAIIAAAHRLRAGTLYSEDLNDGQRYGEILVANPFQIRTAD